MNQDYYPSWLVKIAESTKDFINRINYNKGKKIYFVLTIKADDLRQALNISEPVFNRVFYYVPEPSTEKDKFQDNLSKINKFFFGGIDSFYNRIVLNLENLPSLSDFLLPKNSILAVANSEKWNFLKKYIDIYFYKNTTTYIDLYCKIIGMINNNQNRDQIDSAIIQLASKYELEADFVKKFTSGDSSQNYKTTKIEHTLKYCLTIFDIHMALGFDLLLYLPIHLYDVYYLAIIIITEFEAFSEHENFLSFLFNFNHIVIQKALLGLFYSTLSYELRKHARRSAVAAIMARNLSHYDSHIETGIQNRLDTFCEEIIKRLGWK